jgi:hypothetical protein
MVLVSGMGVEAGAVAGRHGALEDGEVPRDPAVHLRQPTALAPSSSRPVRRADQARGNAGVEQEPGDRHVERLRQRGKGLE